MNKLSHDGKFTISYDKAEGNTQKICLVTEKEISVWELAQAIYIDCICDGQIDANTLQCTVQTSKIKTEVTISRDLSVEETLFKICDFIKL